MIQQDVEKLSHIDFTWGDAAKLKGGDAERLKANDTEKLAKYNDATKLGQIASDAEKLGVVYVQDNEKLRCDVEKLGLTDMEKLSGNGGNGGNWRDTEKLGRAMIYDAEKLGLNVGGGVMR